MEALLINLYAPKPENGPKIEAVARQLVGANVEIVDYYPGLQLTDAGKDIIVGSGGGGEGKETKDTDERGHDYYESLYEFFRNSSLPKVFICMSFEVWMAAHGVKVLPLTKPVEELNEVTTYGKNGYLKVVSQTASHEYGLQEVPAGFEVLGANKHGIKIVRSKDGREIGTQDHPERPGDIDVREMVGQVLRRAA